SCRDRPAATRIQCGKPPWRRIDGTGWPVSMMRKGGDFKITGIGVLMDVDHALGMKAKAKASALGGRISFCWPKKTRTKEKGPSPTRLTSRREERRDFPTRHPASVGKRRTSMCGALRVWTAPRWFTKEPSRSCHPGESRDPEVFSRESIEQPKGRIPAFAGMTESCALR